MSLHPHSVADETTRRALCSIQGRIAVRARVTLRSVPARDETAADGAWARGGGGRAPSGSGVARRGRGSDFEFLVGTAPPPAADTTRTAVPFRSPLELGGGRNGGCRRRCIECARRRPNQIHHHSSTGSGGPLYCF